MIPIGYHEPKERIIAKLEKVNGIYIPGDSDKARINIRYLQAFGHVFDYFEHTNKDQGDYFPMFLMGKSSVILSDKKSAVKTILAKDQKNWQNRNVQLRLLKEFDDTFLFH